MFAMCQCRVRVPHQRQAEPPRIPARLHGVARGEGTGFRDRGQRAQGPAGREGREDRHAVQDAQSPPHSPCVTLARHESRSFGGPRICEGTIARQGGYFPRTSVAVITWSRELGLILHGALEWPLIHRYVCRLCFCCWSRADHFPQSLSSARSRRMESLAQTLTQKPSYTFKVATPWYHSPPRPR